MEHRNSGDGRNTNNRGGSDGIRPNPDHAPHRKVDHTRRIYELEMKKAQSEGISRADRADSLNKEFSKFIYKINRIVEHTIDNQIKEEFKPRIQALSQKYRDMFTVAIEQYPKLFGKEVPHESAGPSQHTGEEQQPPLSKKAGKLPESAGPSQHTGEEQPLLPQTDDKTPLPKLIERIKKKDMIELVAGTSQKHRDEMTARLAVGEVKDLYDNLTTRLLINTNTRQREKIAERDQQITTLNEDNARLTQELKDQRATTYAAFKRFDTEFEQLTQLEKTIDTASTDEIRLGLSEGEMARMATSEDSIQRTGTNIKQQNIPWKIKYCEDQIAYYEKEISNKNNSLYRINHAKKRLEIESLYKADLESLQQKLKDQYHEIWKQVNKDTEARKKLMRLRTKFESVYLDFKNSMEMLGNQDDAHSPLNQAVTSYQAQLGPDAVSPSISAVSAMLAKYADALEKKFDAKIAKMHKQLKVAAEDLGLEEFRGYYLQRQIRKTGFYSEHLSLVHIRQADRSNDCGIICVLMAAADKNKGISIKELEMKIIEEIEKFSAKTVDGLTYTIHYPMLLKAIGHPIDYQLVRDPMLIYLPDPHLDQQYYDYMGHHPQDITAAELKKAIGQKDENGDPITVFAGWTRERDEKYSSSHVVIIDALVKDEDGEEWVIYRNPLTIEASTTGQLLGEGDSMRLKDFLENWNGTAAIPILDK